MATKKVTDAKVIRVAAAVDPSIVPVDEETPEDLEAKVLAIRDTYAYVNVPLTLYMERLWGAFTAIRTGTDKRSSTVWLYRAEPGQKGAVPVSRTGTQNSVAFSLALPLKKLNLRPTADRQWNLVPIQQPITGQLPAFLLVMTERDSIPREVKAEGLAKAQAKVQQAIAKKAERLKAQLAKIGAAGAERMAEVTGEELDEATDA